MAERKLSPPEANHFEHYALLSINSAKNLMVLEILALKDFSL